MLVRKNVSSTRPAAHYLAGRSTSLTRPPHPPVSPVRRNVSTRMNAHAPMELPQQRKMVLVSAMESKSAQRVTLVMLLMGQSARPTNAHAPMELPQQRRMVLVSVMESKSAQRVTLVMLLMGQSARPTNAHAPMELPQQRKMV